MLPVRYPMERNRVKYLKLFDREKIMYATMNRLECKYCTCMQVCLLVSNGSPIASDKEFLLWMDTLYTKVLGEIKPY